MKPIELNPNQVKVLDLHFSKLLESKDIAYYPLSEAVHKELIYTLVVGLDKEKPNESSQSIVINPKGELFELAPLLKKIGKDIFSEIATEAIRIPVRATTTISPNVNNLILNICDKFGEKINVHIPAHPERKVDVYFLVDSTGSMSGAISNVKANMNTIINTLSTAYTDISFGVGDYKDFNSGDPYCFKNQLSLTQGNTALVQSAVNAINASGGGDNDEGQFFAMHQIATTPVVGWRTNATKILVWFGDQPAHDPICASVNGTALNITENILNATSVSITDELVLAKIRVLAINLGSATTGINGQPRDSYTTCPVNGNAGQASRITTATSGALLSNVNAAALSTAIIQIIQNSLQLIHNVSLVPTGVIQPFICSINPKHGYNNLDATKAHDLEFIVCFKGTKLCGREDRFYKGTFDVVADGTVLAQKKVTIEVPACKSKGKCGCGCCED